MSNDIKRELQKTFFHALDSKMADFRFPKNCQHRDRFAWNFEANARVEAFVAAADRAGRLVKTDDIDKVASVMRRSGIKYEPPVRDENGRLKAPAVAYVAHSEDDAEVAMIARLERMVVAARSTC